MLAYVGIFIYLQSGTVWVSAVFRPVMFSGSFPGKLVWEHPPIHNLSGSARSGGWVERTVNPSTLGSRAIAVDSTAAVVLTVLFKFSV